MSLFTPIMFACHMRINGSPLGCGAPPGEKCREPSRVAPRTLEIDSPHITRRALAARANRSFVCFGRNLAVAGALTREYTRGRAGGSEP